MIDSPWLAVATIAGAITVGVVSPGPSFVMVARTALARSRTDGLAAALGMGLGGAFFALLALFGLHALLVTVPTLHTVLRIAGGAYLVWLGIRIWRGARAPLAVAADPSAHDAARPWRAFAAGLATQVSNPKTAVVYGSVFASLLPPAVPLGVQIALPLVVFVVETAWYATVAVVLSAAAPRERYLRAKTAIDRLAGGVMTTLGIKLLVDARHPG